jgi:hypothetical protein
MPFYYRIYGLHVTSNRVIPTVTPAEITPTADVHMCLGCRPAWMPRNAESDSDLWYASPDLNERGKHNLSVWKLAGGDYYRFVYGDETEFIVGAQGSRIWSTWPDSATIADTAVYLLGPVLGFVLRLRGIIPLHASAVAVGDRAIAFVGPACAGKSTTAAAFARLGYRVLSDDVVALCERDGQFLVQPGYPILRLWPKSANVLYGSYDALPRLTPAGGINGWWDKRYLDLQENGNGFQEIPLPLAAIYMIDERRCEPAAPALEPMALGTGLIRLVSNSYVNYLLDGPSRAHEFSLLGRLAACVPLRNLIPHSDPAYLGRLCELVLQDCPVSFEHPLPPVSMVPAGPILQ